MEIIYVLNLLKVRRSINRVDVMCGVEHILYCAEC